MRPPNNGKTPPIESPGTIPDKLPPFNEDAERAVIGSILLDDFRLADLAPLQLAPDDFYIHRYRWIYQAMLDLHQNGQPAGSVTLLCDKLTRDGYLDEVGGPAELSSLIRDTEASSYALHYAGIVKDCSKRRKRLDILGALARLAHDESNEDYEARFVELQQQLEDITSEGSADDWEIFTLADAYQERPPACWVINGLFSLPSLNIVYGGPGTLKSLLMADGLTCVAAGLPWLESLPGQSVKPFQTVPAPVLWVDFDNGKRRTDERFEALGRARNLPADVPLHYTSMPSPWLDASDSLAVDRLINRINRLEAKLVVLDNLGTISGEVDENSPAMIPVMSNLRRLAEKTGAAIVVIHHQRKGTGLKGRAGDNLRGHSCIEAALDLALLVERKEDNDRISVKSTKTRDVDVLPFSAEWTYEHKPGTTELATAKFFGIATEKDEKLETLQLTITACAATEPGLSNAKLWQAVKSKLPDVGKHTIRAEIEAMAESRQLVVSTNGIGKALAYYPKGEIDF